MNDAHSEILDARAASALFANMVLQQTNMALIFMGKTPNPETGEVLQDLQTAKLLIDQLEMLAIKTKGNLDANESALMNESLATVRMAFVETIEHAPKIPSPAPVAPQDKSPPSSPSTAAPAAGPATSAEPAEDVESRKKFSKRH